MRKNKKYMIAVIMILVVIFLSILLLQNQKSENTDHVKKNPPSENTEKISNSYEEFLSEYISNTIEENSDFVEPDSGALDISKITGYRPDKGDKENSKTTEETASDNNAAQEQENAESSNKPEENTAPDNESPLILSDSNLVIQSVGGYTGNYLEDGSDDPVSEVAAIIITNNSNQMLQVGDISFAVKKNETAMFRVTNLLPGASALVLESSRRTYSSKDDYSYGNAATAYLEETSLHEEILDITGEDGKLTLLNKTNTSFKKIYVYYKYARVGGVYMGGITYRVPFENVKGKDSVDSLANHFNKASSRIIDVQIIES